MILNLSELAQLHKSDKCDSNHTFAGLSYTDIYSRYFEPIRYQHLNILEIGVLRGASLRMWKEYFPNSIIYGLDIDPACKNYEEDRIHITVGSQTDSSVLQQVVNEAQLFDVIIDDGSHVNRMIETSFKYLWPHLVSKGWYIIEDLGCSFQACWESWPGMSLNSSKNFDNKREEIEAFYLEMLRNMDRHLGNVLSIQFWPYIMFTQKV